MAEEGDDRDGAEEEEELAEEGDDTQGGAITNTCFAFGMPEGLKGEERRFYISNAVLAKLTVQNVMKACNLRLVLKMSANIGAQVMGRDGDEGT